MNQPILWEGKRSLEAFPGLNTSRVAAVDLDNVIARTDPVVRDIIHSISGIWLEERDISAWDYATALVAKGLDPVTAEDVRTQAFRRFHDRDCTRLAVVDGALEGLRALNDRGYEIRIVTGREASATCIQRTRAWLRDHSIPEESLALEQNKASVCQTWAFLVDDAPHHAREVASAGVAVYLFDYPWNVDVSHRLVKRVRGWPELIEKITHGRFEAE